MQETIQEVYVPPEQFFVQSRESQQVWNGERQLLLAVLEHAIHDFYKYRHSHTRRGERLFREVKQWLWSPERNWLYAFESICLHLNLDPNAVRQRLQHDEADTPQASRAGQRARHENVVSHNRLSTAA